MRKYLRDTSEFQHVYRNGKRYEGVFITAFVIENQELNHRLGVTASKKALGKAVQRNRAKRLLREAFRSNETFLSELARNYDWVLNAKAAVLHEKLDAPFQDLKGIIEKVGRLEARNTVR
ncbi:MAG TPA: ribonuclease P protein component [Pyrinomonadaceae bacterium]|nr:ribonuclease P protein component [Pyrinomonadaceae bacterium]